MTYPDLIEKKRAVLTLHNELVDKFGSNVFCPRQMALLREACEITTLLKKKFGDAPP